MYELLRKNTKHLFEHFFFLKHNKLKNNIRLFRSASSARSFSIFSGKCLFAHQTKPITPKTIKTVISPSQNGSCNILSDKGLYGMFIILFSQRAPSHQAKQLFFFKILIFFLILNKTNNY